MLAREPAPAAGERKAGGASREGGCMSVDGTGTGGSHSNTSGDDNFGLFERALLGPVQPYSAF